MTPRASSVFAITVSVSILTRPEGRVQLSPGKPKPSQPCFNPHPARRPGATRSKLDRAPVSILTRPEGRVQRPVEKVAGRAGSTMFQSSPGQKAGCNWIPSALHHPRTPSFNPHPARRPGATVGAQSLGIAPIGSVLVSILTRPEGRVQQAAADKPKKPNEAVSILTRPEGRVQLLGESISNGSVLISSVFQSSPGQKAGCNLPDGPGFPYSPVDLVFQSSPGQKAGCNNRWKTLPANPLGACFNPHPARRPGATLSDAPCARVNHPDPVSILTRPEGRVQHGLEHR